MCDYCLHSVASRPAQVGDRLVTTKFRNTLTRGFSAVGDPGVAVCLLPGTEVAFDAGVQRELNPLLAILFGKEKRLIRQKLLGSDRSTSKTQRPIMTPLHSLTGRWCCSHVCVPDSKQRYCNYRYRRTRQIKRNPHPRHWLGQSHCVTRSATTPVNVRGQARKLKDGDLQSFCDCHKMLEVTRIATDSAIRVSRIDIARRFMTARLRRLPYQLDHEPPRSHVRGTISAAND